MLISTTVGFILSRLDAHTSKYSVTFHCILMSFCNQVCSLLSDLLNRPYWRIKISPLKKRTLYFKGNTEAFRLSVQNSTWAHMGMKAKWVQSSQALTAILLGFFNAVNSFKLITRGCLRAAWIRQQNWVRHDWVRSY